MSTCARCGDDACEAEAARNGTDPVWGFEAAVDCRDRELSNLRSLLRSVTGKLEEAAELLSLFDEYEPGGGLSVPEVQRVIGIVDSVLEVLS